MVTSSEDGTVKIWETRTGNIQRSYTHGCPVNDVVIHPNQGEIISCDRSGYVRVWDLAENTCAHELTPEADVSVSSVTVASDGTILCAANNSVCYFFFIFFYFFFTIFYGLRLKKQHTNGQIHREMFSCGGLSKSTTAHAWCP